MPEHVRAKLDTMQCLLEKIVSKAGFVCVYDGSNDPKDIDWLETPTFYTRVYRCRQDGEWINTWIKFIYDLRPGPDYGYADFEISWKDLTVFKELDKRQSPDILQAIENGHNARWEVRFMKWLDGIFHKEKVEKTETVPDKLPPVPDGIANLLNTAKSAGAADGADIPTSPKLTNSMLHKAQWGAEALVHKTVSPALNKMDLVTQVAVARSMLALSGTFKMRGDMLSGFADEFKEKSKKGMTDSEILHPYLNCPEFLAFWKDIGLDVEDLKNLLPDKPVSKIG
jgi:hypothetical protein